MVSSSTNFAGFDFSGQTTFFNLEKCFLTLQSIYFLKMSTKMDSKTTCHMGFCPPNSSVRPTAGGFLAKCVFFIFPSPYLINYSTQLKVGDINVMGIKSSEHLWRRFLCIVIVSRNITIYVWWTLSSCVIGEMHKFSFVVKSGDMLRVRISPAYRISLVVKNSIITWPTSLWSFWRKRGEDRTSRSWDTPLLCCVIPVLRWKTMWRWVI